MLCIKKQIGSIPAIAAPAVLCAAGFWNSTGLMDAAFAQVGSWLACMFGFMAIVVVTGIQRNGSIPAYRFLLGAGGFTVLAFGAAYAAVEVVGNSVINSLTLAAIRGLAVIALTGMVVTLFCATQTLWRYANARHREEIDACAGLVRMVSFR